MDIPLDKFSEKEIHIMQNALEQEILRRRKGDDSKITQHWCMCTILDKVLRDGKSTCSICGGKDAYGRSVERPFAKRVDSKITDQHIWIKGNSYGTKGVVCSVCGIRKDAFNYFKKSNPAWLKCYGTL